MRGRVIRSFCCCLLLVGSVSPALTEPSVRPVREEFREAVERIAEAGALKPPETVEFPAREALFVRVVIHETSGSSQPGIDEFEIFGPDKKGNLALAKHGGVARASSVIPGYPIHAVPHLNDGIYGNSHSWIAASNDTEWAQVKLSEPARVSSVVITRDRTGHYRDRIPEIYDVLVSLDGDTWRQVARRDRTAANRTRRLPYMPVDRLPEKSWDGYLQYAFLRERTTWSRIPTR